MQAVSVRPTRMELLGLTRRLNFALRGHKLLQEKQDAIILNLFEILRDYREVKGQILEKLGESYRAIKVAEAEIGPSKLRSIAFSSPTRVDISVKYRNVMGAQIPVLRPQIATAEKVAYAFAATSYRLDDAVAKFKESLRMLVALSEKELALRLLADQIRETRRRVNALEYIVIPQLQSAMRYVEFYLEEREREDFYRLKRAKTLGERRAAASVQ